MAVLYEYHCEGCDHRFEAFSTPGVALFAFCPECGGPADRIYSPPTINCYSFGKDLYFNRVPEHAKKSHTDEQERTRHQMKRDLGITAKPVMKG